MNDLVLEGRLAELREREIRLLVELGDVLARISSEGEQDRQRLREVADDLRNMFYMVVVVGEFNAGKSSFINALLQDELLPTGITPTTEVIELIKHGDQASRRPEMRPDGVRVWTHPNVGGPGVVLVDTPGTGSVFVKHEQVARNFLHRSDLVIFLMSAKHAFAETDRLYLELLRSYGKKVVVVVNQIDLLAPREQADVRRFVQAQIEQRLELKPLIFMVSARRALAGEAESGIDAVRAHLRATFEQLSPARQKLITQLDFAGQLLGRYRQALEDRLALIGQNRERTSQIQQELETYAQSMESQLRTNTEEVVRILDGVRARGDAFIERHFKLRIGGRNGSREAELQREFEEEVIGRSLQQIEDLARDYVNAQVDNNRRYWQGIVSRLNQLDDFLQEEVRGADGSLYTEQRIALQEAIAIADAEMSAYSNAEMLQVMQERFQANLTGLGSSAGLGVLGALAAALGIATPGAITLHVFALLGTVIGIPVAIGGGVFAIRYWLRLRRDVKEDFNGQIDLLERSYRQALAELTERERNRLLQYGRQILEPVFSRFAVLAENIESNLKVLDEVEGQLAALRETLENLD
ncbi:MAG: dynamin family protein [Anaerolineae bacterium]